MSYTEESKATWRVRRDKLTDLLIEAHAPEFKVRYRLSVQSSCREPNL